MEDNSQSDSFAEKEVFRQQAITIAHQGKILQSTTDYMAELSQLLTELFLINQDTINTMGALDGLVDLADDDALPEDKLADALAEFYQQKGFRDEVILTITFNSETNSISVHNKTNGCSYLARITDVGLEQDSA